MSVPFLYDFILVFFYTLISYFFPYMVMIKLIKTIKPDKYKVCFLRNQFIPWILFNFACNVVVVSIFIFFYPIYPHIWPFGMAGVCYVINIVIWGVTMKYFFVLDESYIANKCGTIFTSVEIILQATFAFFHFRWTYTDKDAYAITEETKKIMKTKSFGKLGPIKLKQPKPWQYIRKLTNQKEHKKIGEIQSKYSRFTDF